VSIIRKYTPLVFLLSLISIFGYSIFQSSFSIVVTFFLLGIVGFTLTIFRQSEKSLFLFVYSLSCFAAVMLAWVYSMEYGVPYWQGGSDELHYEQLGVEFANNFGILDYKAIRGGMVYEWHNSVGYIYFVGILAKFCQLFGEFHTMIPRLSNAFFLSLVSVNLFKLGLRFGMNKKIAFNAALLCGCLPLMIWVSVQKARDILQTYLLLSLVSLWLPIKQTQNINKGFSF